MNEVGRVVGCAPSSVMRWREVRHRSGKQGLKVRSSPGRPPKLGPGERRRLYEIAAQGSNGSRVSNGVVDHGADRRVDRARVWSHLPSRSRRTPHAQPRLESPETEATCP
ncbi:MAG: hypothetical protein HQ546_11455 [Planctomycetes bacterium]|nr:hypothetical protein [Planctomycetota bacterium]